MASIIILTCLLAFLIALLLSEDIDDLLLEFISWVFVFGLIAIFVYATLNIF